MFLAGEIDLAVHGEGDKIQDALGLGANEYIMKPFDAEIIESKLFACGVQ